jgi:D-glycero-D-manno-heptose 1,7-bisphosphate phosphatase
MQAVILAGGFGTRLRPLTSSVPKPLISIGGRPFAEYLVRRLQSQGFQKVIFLIGYKGDQFRATFGDGADFDLSVEYVETPPEYDTGARLKAALPILDEHFFLLYGDIYWPFHFDVLWESYVTAGRRAQIVAYENTDHYSLSNILLSADGAVSEYDKSRQKLNLTHVDLGHLIIDRQAVADLPDTNGDALSLEAAIYPSFSAAGQLHAFSSPRRYYSLSLLHRLFSLERCLNGPRYVFLDRDGVLNRKMRKGEYVTTWDEWHWEHGALEALRLLNEKKVRCIVVTNQAGIALGKITQPALDAIHTRMVLDIRQNGGNIEHVFCCPHHWNDNCNCRKPKPGLLLQAHREFHFDLTLTPLIGDGETDKLAADALQVPFYRVDADNSLLSIVRTIDWSSNDTQKNHAF